MPTSDDDPNGLRGLAYGSWIVTQLIVPILLGVWADNHWQSAPQGVVVGCVVGFVAGGWASYRVFRRMNGNQQRGGTPPLGS